MTQIIGEPGADSDNVLEFKKKIVCFHYTESSSSPKVKEKKHLAFSKQFLQNQK